MIQNEIKTKLHPRNKHRERYDFKQLTASCSELESFVSLNDFGNVSIDFANPEAVKTLNRALLKYFYDIENWEIPPNYLCPPIPGRADYIHHIADLLAASNGGIIPTGKRVTCLDIGVGANCVYPIIGRKEYGWTFIGSDIDAVSISSANKIIDANPILQTSVECRFQANPNNIFSGIIAKDEFIDFSICNPPFHSSMAEANRGTLRKLSNLNNKKITKPASNFGGKNNELWCDGGEEKFVKNMIHESQEFWNSCFWFSTLISKQSTLKNVYSALDFAEVFDVKTIQMGQGNKISRVVAWTFLNPKQQKAWQKLRWRAKK
jgi:23S rRNA (adenine1618-N6)-methyltransferase